MDRTPTGSSPLASATPGIDALDLRPMAVTTPDTLAGYGNGEGGDPGGPPDQAGLAPTRPPGRKTPSAKPALIVVLIAAGIFLVFGIGSALNKGTSAPLKNVVVKGAPLTATPAAKPLLPIEQSDTPPADILGALVLPKDASRVATQTDKWDEQTQFSASMGFQVDASQATVISFYEIELRGHGWDVINVGPAHNDPTATQVLATKASNDGWYWEIGVTASPTTFPSGTIDRTPFKIELFEETDVN